MKNTVLIVPLTLLALGQALAQTSGNANAKVGDATRKWLGEQTQGDNRAEAVPFRAEAAGAAYKKYQSTFSASTGASAGTTSAGGSTGATSSSSASGSR